MDPNGRVIPIVEDDQGEGFKDPWEEPSLLDKETQNLYEQQAQETLKKKKKSYKKRRLSLSLIPP